ncbi:MAG: 2-oxoglutarate dehydrogenase E1 component [Desulfuromonadales bacterium]|uniref:2-oxoglutarate dehydrogenase E1 component n=1 Tax=Desulfuromonas sp. KJ2020 TaxID=2919173 RepID=UPI0020A6E1E4|nr:2-oxoglutarate dehydrogenase E1 component [Desulfuromonas sp. KJ2020]MCP3176569.1 2-oxoglutarate dehydrogenase E1 component [Desulfuromonas sp. KJ2020]
MTFLDNASPDYFDAQYALWKKDPQQVPRQWQLFFEGFTLGRTESTEAAPADACHALELKQSAVQSLLYRYRSLGHLLACTDPLNPCPLSHPLLDLEAFGLEETDRPREFHTKRFLKESATLEEILTTMQETYCRSIGVEFMHIQDPAERQWLIDRMESCRNRPSFSLAEKKSILQKLQQATLFENFLHRKFLGQKRFSLEGGEIIIPLVDRFIHRAATLSLKTLVLGMAHRGRLNVLANNFHKPLENIFAEFKDNLEYEFVGEGDVKYHKGFSIDHDFPDQESLHLTMASNPSHLEAVNPVVEGKARARQEALGESGTKLVLPVLLHGDAAFAGQGMVAETLNLSQLEGYSTGGTVHIVLNNQIGFTTAPADARSTHYATDMAKMLMVPIFHIHGEDPEAAAYVADLALDYRQRYGRDVILEVICYRRHGHNEGDEPYFTQPLMYEKIKERPPAYEIYGTRLQEEGVPPEEIEAMAESFSQKLEEALEKPGKQADAGFRGKWQDIDRDTTPAPVTTAVSADTLQDIARRLAQIPDDFTPHPKIATLLQKRLEAIDTGEEIDWGNAEHLALATLLQEGKSVRLSGQDVRRGTFNHRHAVLVDAKNGATFMPLATLAADKAACRIYNSMLSEAAVLGFDYGYSLETPYTLTIWEAQFGDFANGAQVIIDQFIASGSSKWDRHSGLTLFLPHGFEGQGAEHSSARIERFLQLCADNNLQAANPTTPAQFFHLLRRQVLQPFRRPLIVFTPKSLLRHPACRSRLEAFTDGRFEEFLLTAEKPETVKTLLFCSGKIFYELQEKAKDEGHDAIALVRVEQLYPWHGERLQELLAPFVQLERVVWVQEEPRNAGAWEFVRPRLAKATGLEPDYIGREPAAAPAVGSHRLHKKEQEEILEAAFST